MAPFWHPKSTKIHAKIDSKRHPKNDRFLDRFFAQVGSILGPKLGPKSRSRRSQNAPQDIPKTPPRQPKSHKSIQDRNLVHFWSQSPMGYAPLASIFKVFNTLEFKFWCQICASPRKPQESPKMYPKRAMSAQLWNRFRIRLRF